jgi:endonuclease G
MLGSVSRRRLFALLGSGLVGGGALTARRALAQSAPEADLSDEAVREILLAEAEPGGGPINRATIKPFWFQKPEGSRPAPNWPPDNVSFDYGHIADVPNVGEPFELTGEVLAKLCAANSFQRNPAATNVLFGLRGCLLAQGGDHADWTSRHALQATRPNHIDLRCVFGVWNTANNTVALFKGSTVPNVELMEKQIEGTMKSNMLPTGMHQYSVGPHKGERQPGAFIQQTPLWVIRSKKTLGFAANDAGIEWDDLDGKLPFDDIHAAILDARKKPPYFSSAGCQTIAGNYLKGVPTGAWAEFRKAAGLAHPLQFVTGSRQDTRDDGRRFDYVLLTGKEAQLAAAGNTARLRTLRFGSSGDRVSELQEKLLAGPEGAGMTKSGVFDVKTLGGVLRWQKENKLAPSGIIAVEAAAKLGLNWS